MKLHDVDVTTGTGCIMYSGFTLVGESTAGKTCDRSSSASAAEKAFECHLDV
jgi:hypothetical protein